jgi:N,N'-diacetylchitobiose transport system permease protein
MTHLSSPLYYRTSNRSRHEPSPHIIIISLSVIWDFQVFSHIWIFLDSRPSAEYYTMAIYAFQKSFGLSEYGMGAAISLIMIFTLITITGYYLRQMMKMGNE